MKKNVLLLILVLALVISGCSRQASGPIRSPISPEKPLNELSTADTPAPKADIITRRPTTTPSDTPTPTAAPTPTPSPSSSPTFASTPMPTVKATTVPTTADPVTGPSAETPDKSKIVYVTDTGKKYHRDGCRYLTKSKHEITLEEALAKGCTPCSACKP